MPGWQNSAMNCRPSLSQAPLVFSKCDDRPQRFRYKWWNRTEPYRRGFAIVCSACSDRCVTHMWSDVGFGCCNVQCLAPSTWPRDECHTIRMFYVFLWGTERIPYAWGSALDTPIGGFVREDALSHTNGALFRRSKFRASTFRTRRP